MGMKPVLFNTDMVQAILDGRKTVTRRIFKTEKYIPSDAKFGYSSCTPNGYISYRGIFVRDGIERYGEGFVKLPYSLGDILYVRETWQDLGSHYTYKADEGSVQKGHDAFFVRSWRPSIHMPKEAARIFLRVTDVRVERLRDIRRDEAVREGASPACAVLNFKAIWNTTIKPADRDRYGWDANPWVWVIEFERISKEEAYDAR